MTPTTHLRFVVRGKVVPTLTQVTDYAATAGMTYPQALTHLTRPGKRILQQWWSEGKFISVSCGPDGCVGEWRDVPEEEEEP